MPVAVSLGLVHGTYEGRHRNHRDRGDRSQNIRSHFHLIDPRVCCSSPYDLKLLSSITAGSLTKINVSPDSVLVVRRIG